MAFGGRITMRRNLSPKRIVGKLIGIILLLWIGDEILTTVGATIDTNTGFFQSAFDFLGMNYDAGTTPSGILTVIGIVAVASLVLEFINVNL